MDIFRLRLHMAIPLQPCVFGEDCLGNGYIPNDWNATSSFPTIGLDDTDNKIHVNGPTECCPYCAPRVYRDRSALIEKIEDPTIQHPRPRQYCAYCSGNSFSIRIQIDNNGNREYISKYGVFCSMMCGLHDSDLSYIRK